VPKSFSKYASHVSMDSMVLGSGSAPWANPGGTSTRPSSRFGTEMRSVTGSVP
jgi:hypothetical protein